MIKKTTITTEKHEVWVIRSPAEGLKEHASINQSDSGSEVISPIDSEILDNQVPDDQPE
jgi:hypothetical protein